MARDLWYTLIVGFVAGLATRPLATYLVAIYYARGSRMPQWESLERRQMRHRHVDHL